MRASSLKAKGPGFESQLHGPTLLYVLSSVSSTKGVKGGELGFIYIVHSNYIKGKVVIRTNNMLAHTHTTETLAGHTG